MLPSFLFHTAASPSISWPAVTLLSKNVPWTSLSYQRSKTGLDKELCWRPPPQSGHSQAEYGPFIKIFVRWVHQRNWERKRGVEVYGADNRISTLPSFFFFFFTSLPLFRSLDRPWTNQLVQSVPWTSLSYLHSKTAQAWIKNFVDVTHFRLIIIKRSMEHSNEYS